MKLVGRWRTWGALLAAFVALADGVGGGCCCCCFALPGTFDASEVVASFDDVDLFAFSGLDLLDEEEGKTLLISFHFAFVRLISSPRTDDGCHTFVVMQLGSAQLGSAQLSSTQLERPAAC